MLVFAEADAVRTAHMIEFFALLGGGQRDAGLAGAAGRPKAQLAILPCRLLLGTVYGHSVLAEA